MENELKIIKKYLELLIMQNPFLMNTIDGKPVYGSRQAIFNMHIFSTIKSQLLEKGVSAPLVEQLIKVSFDLFKADRYPPFSDANVLYMKMFLSQLRSIAEDQRGKNWNIRLRLFAIKYNLNHMGVYKFLEAEHEREVLSVKNEVKQLDLIYAKTIWLQQIQVIPDLAYNNHADDLKTLLLDHIRSLKDHLKERAMYTARQPDKLRTNQNVHELALQLHYLFEDEGLLYPTKKEAAEALCTHIQSKETDNISPRSLLKFDRLEQLKAARQLYERNQRIQARLAKDFDL